MEELDPNIESNLDRKYRWYTINLLDSRKKVVHYVFRGMTREELRLAGTKPTQNAADDLILKRCVYGTRDWDLVLYGHIRQILNHIYRISGVTDDAITAQEAVAWIETPEGIIEACAVGFCEGCTFRLLYEADPSDYSKYCLTGKFMFQVHTGKSLDSLLGVEPETPINPAQSGTDYTNVGLNKQTIQTGKDQTKEVEQFVWKKPTTDLNIKLSKEDVATVLKDEAPILGGKRKSKQ